MPPVNLAYCTYQSWFLFTPLLTLQTHQSLSLHLPFPTLGINFLIGDICRLEIFNERNRDIYVVHTVIFYGVCLNHKMRDSNVSARVRLITILVKNINLLKISGLSK